MQKEKSVKNEDIKILKHFLFRLAAVVGLISLTYYLTIGIGGDSNGYVFITAAGVMIFIFVLLLLVEAVILFRKQQKRQALSDLAILAMIIFTLLHFLFEP